MALVIVDRLMTDAASLFSTANTVGIGTAARIDRRIALFRRRLYADDRTERAF